MIPPLPDQRCPGRASLTFSKIGICCLFGLDPIRSIQIALCPLHSLSKHYCSYEPLCYREVVANDTPRGLSHVACDHFLPQAEPVASAGIPERAAAPRLRG